MDGLRHFKEELQRVYGRNDYWLVPAFRSVFSMLLFFLLCRFFSIDGKMANPMVILLFSLFFRFALPYRGLSFILFLFAISFSFGHCFNIFYLCFFIAKQCKRKVCHFTCGNASLLFPRNPLFFAITCGIDNGAPGSSFLRTRGYGLLFSKIYKGV